MSFPTVSDMPGIEASHAVDRRNKRLGKMPASTSSFMDPPEPTLPEEPPLISDKQSKAIAKKQQQQADKARAAARSKALYQLNKKLQLYGRRFPDKLKESGIKLKTSYRSYEEAYTVYQEIRELFDQGNVEEHLRDLYPQAAGYLEQNGDALGINITGYTAAVKWSLTKNEQTGKDNNEELGDMMGEFAIEYGSWFRAGLTTRFIAANAKMLAYLHRQNTYRSARVSQDVQDEIQKEFDLVQSEQQDES